jgi:tRNA (cmo5U34)-methyltransferase
VNNPPNSADVFKPPQRRALTRNFENKIMTEFNKSQWAKSEFTSEYRDSADIIIVERRRLFSILQSFYMHFIANKSDSRVLDLGCGDGIVIYELLKADSSLKATLIDGSEDMLIQAKDRLRAYQDLQFIRASFQEILDGTVNLENYDFIVSSMATHHLTMKEKTALFKTIYSHLHVGGCFLNADVVLAPSDTIEHWYLQLWRQWIDERKSILEVEGCDYDDVIRRYKDNTDNKPDLLSSQLGSLKDIGFKDVDCFYKYGIFSMYGGKKG